MKPLQDYSFIKGVNYALKTDDAVLRRELGYGRRLGVNSVRIWLSYHEYEARGQAYVDELVHYIRVCRAEGVSVMPILFNGNGLDPAVLEEAFLPRGEAYAAAIVRGIQNEDGLLMYDIMNEPPCNDLILQAPSQEIKDETYQKIWAFVRHFCTFVKQLDPVNAITVGNWLACDIESSADLVDVIAYHDYSPTLAQAREMAQLALSFGKKYQKPVINNETCCIARANPYDTVIQLLDELQIPWYVFNLMIEGYWAEVHGIFYKDGTVRDPAIAAAMVGCFRSRDLQTILPEKPNREMFASKEIDHLRAILLDSQADAFRYSAPKLGELLDACETLANLLEGGQLVPMQIPPTARIAAWRREASPNLYEIKRFAYSLARQAQECCQIL